MVVVSSSGCNHRPTQVIVQQQKDLVLPLQNNERKQNANCEPLKLLFLLQPADCV